MTSMMLNTDFQFYQALLLEKSGLALSEEKTYLLETRLKPVALSLGYAKLEDFTLDVRKKDPALVRSVIEAMTTNETSFFRDTKPFNILRELLPHLAKARESKKTLRIWSAACSSGQEAYSIAITLQEFFSDKPGWKCQIVGTDISEDILAQARKGEYSQFEIQRGLSIQMMVKYFTQSGNNWHIKDELKNMVRFQNLNLLDNMASMGTFDIIFCRNVLIYFNPKTKTQVLTKLKERMAPDGYLFLGACETIINLDVPLAPENGMQGVFRCVNQDVLCRNGK